MRKFIIIFCVVVAIPAGVLADTRVTPLVRIVDYLLGQIQDVKGLAASVRASIGPAKEELILLGRAKLSRLDPIFREAQTEAERVEHEALIERWRERADRTSDLVETYKKIDELKGLLDDRERLQNELCGPRDLYRFAGDC